MHPHPEHTPHKCKNALGAEHRTNRITQPVSLISQECKTSSVHNDCGQILPYELTTAFLVQYLGYWPCSCKDHNYTVKTMIKTIPNNSRSSSKSAPQCCGVLLKIERWDNAKCSGL